MQWLSFGRLPLLAALALTLGACTGEQRPQTGAVRATIDPETLIGLDGPGLAATLGDPTRVRKEDSAEIWQYQGGSCVFDLFLYPEGSAHKVVLYEARDVAGKKVAPNPCVNDVLQTRQNAVS